MYDFSEGGFEYYRNVRVDGYSDYDLVQVGDKFQ